MLDWLYELIGTMLSWFSIGGSYAIGLLFYALVFKLLFLPFSIKQQKNQIKMAKLAPQLELIKAKYRGRTDHQTQQKMQQEIMEFQTKEGYSPLAGCLPMLLQLPIIIFLYNIIRNPLSYICQLEEEAVRVINQVVNTVDGVIPELVEFKSIDQIGLIGKINTYLTSGGEGLGEYMDKLALRPDFTLFGIDLAATPSFTNISLTVLIPIIAAVLTWLSMYLNRKWNGNSNPAAAAQDAQAQASMKIMDLMMPAMTLFIAFSFSGMLGLYWIYQSVLGILQTFILSRAMPLPKYTEEELKAMKKAQKAAEKAQKAALKEAPRYRSLHYIDEEDYEELPNLTTENEKKNGSAGLDIPDIKD